jgi:hypothetical protein
MPKASGTGNSDRSNSLLSASEVETLGRANPNARSLYAHSSRNVPTGIAQRIAVRGSVHFRFGYYPGCDTPEDPYPGVLSRSRSRSRYIYYLCGMRVSETQTQTQTQFINVNYWAWTGAVDFPETQTQTQTGLSRQLNRRGNAASLRRSIYYTAPSSMQ